MKSFLIAKIVKGNMPQHPLCFLEVSGGRKDYNQTMGAGVVSDGKYFGDEGLPLGRGGLLAAAFSGKPLLTLQA